MSGIGDRRHDLALTAKRLDLVSVVQVSKVTMNELGLFVALWARVQHLELLVDCRRSWEVLGHRGGVHADQRVLGRIVQILGVSIH